MTCPTCGEEVKSGQQFCPNCGASLVEKNPGEVPGAEYMPRYCRWLWIALYRVGKYARLHISYKDESVRNSVRFPGKNRGVVTARRCVTLLLILNIFFGLVSLNLSKEPVLERLALFIFFSFFVAMVIPFYKAVKAMRNTLGTVELLLVELPIKLLLVLEMLAMALLIVFMKHPFQGLGDVAIAFFVFYVTVKQPFLLLRAQQMEQAIPGWLGLFDAEGEGRGPEGERYVDRNLDIWCRTHPAFLPVKKDCVSNYSNHCIKLGNKGSPITPQEYDHILVGPGIIIHIETKSYGGQLEVVNEDQWRRKNKSGNGYEILDSPYNQALRHDMLLRSIVGGNVSVVPLICLADACVKITRQEYAGDIELVGIASLQARLSEIYERYSEVYPQDASDLDETDRLLALLDDHKVGRMNI